MAMASINSFQCKCCSKSFSGNGVLRRHARKFHPGMDVPDCLRSGPHAKECAVERHLERCEACGKTFFHKASLRRHKYIVHGRSVTNPVCEEQKELKFMNIAGNFEIFMC